MFQDSLMASALFKKHALRLGRFCARFSLGRISADQRTRRLLGQGVNARDDAAAGQVGREGPNCSDDLACSAIDLSHARVR